MVKVVYFNQWFSSIGNIIKDLKERNKNNIKIIASSKNKNVVYRNDVDVFIEEDWKEEDSVEQSMINYTNWVLNTCIEYSVDIFFVKKHAKYIMQHSKEFSLHDIFLVSENLDTLTEINCKHNVYAKLVNNTKLSHYIPDYLWAVTKDSQLDYILEHQGKNNICLKLDEDEGGSSYRAIDDSSITYQSLSKPRVNTITTSEAMHIIATTDKAQRLLFMERLDSPEISIDCYNSNQGFIAICREKVDGRLQKIYYNEELSKLCENIGKILGLRFPYNVQFRYKQGIDHNNIENLRLLEVNPRMSGGVYYELQFGLNIAHVCYSDINHNKSNYNISDYINFPEHYITHIEKAVKL